MNRSDEERCVGCVRRRLAVKPSEKDEFQIWPSERATSANALVAVPENAPVLIAEQHRKWACYFRRRSAREHAQAVARLLRACSRRHDSGV